MKKLLLLTSSPRGTASQSTRIATHLVAELRGHQHALEVTLRDLAKNPPVHVDEDFITATRSDAGAANTRQQAALAQSDALVDELLAADTLVIAAGMINLGIPSSLKAWIDQIMRPQRTFRYGANGAEGLVTGRKAILVLASGGIYSSGPTAQFDHLRSYLEHILGFIGFTEITAVFAEGLAYGPEVAGKAINLALAQASDVAQRLAQA